MLQVRIVCQQPLTDQLLGLLAADAGVLNLAVGRAAAVRPAGDSIQFDLLTASANPVLQQLRDLGATDYAPVAVQIVDAPIPDPEDRGGWRWWRRPNFGGVAPIWELVRSRIKTDAVYAPSFFLLLIIAALLAAVGIMTNSQILVVGAMVVGPELSAIMSVASGIESRQWIPVRTGLAALVIGFLLAVAVTFAFAVFIKALGHTPRAYRLGLRPVSDLINSPDLFSVIVAILAAIVGVVSLAEAKANALIGVFISVTTIPAAADIAVSLAYHHWNEARGSALQLLLNVGLLIIVSAITLRVVQMIWRARGGGSGLPRS